MKVAIIGAGFGGLAAAYRLVKSGYDINVFEAEDKPGGLAVGFENKKWNWPLEAHYHHWFTNDDSILNLAREINHKVIEVRPKTSTFINGKIYRLDSPLSLLMFDKLSLGNRLRTGLVLAYLKFTSRWMGLEKLTAHEFLTKWNGEAAWNVLWKPLFEKKFSRYADEIPASWFWARIKKRTPALAYPEGGFLSFARRLAELIQDDHGNIFYKTNVESIFKKGQKLEVKTDLGSYEFDKVICTLPSALFVKITQGLPEDYKHKLLELKGIGAVNLLLSLKKQFLEDGTYWLNINDRKFPFLAVIEHTNFMDKKYYNNENLVYVGNYLPHEHPYFNKKTEDLLKDFFPYLTRINPRFKKNWINKAYLFKAPFAQPIVPLNYSKIIPSHETPIAGLYLSNIQQVYPWDRGTNYAVENGERVARLVLNERKKQ